MIRNDIVRQIIEKECARVSKHQVYLLREGVKRLIRNINDPAAIIAGNYIANTLQHYLESVFFIIKDIHADYDFFLTKEIDKEPVHLDICHISYDLYAALQSLSLFIVPDTPMFSVNGTITENATVFGDARQHIKFEIKQWGDSIDVIALNQIHLYPFVSEGTESDGVNIKCNIGIDKSAEMSLCLYATDVEPFTLPF